MKFYKFNQIVVISTLVFIIGCSSPNHNEIACNFSSGADARTYDEDGSFSDNLFSDIFIGLLNVFAQGAHRVASPESYDNCKPESNIPKPKNSST
jgi:hypothetical protein